MCGEKIHLFEGSAIFRFAEADADRPFVLEEISSALPVLLVTRSRASEEARPAFQVRHIGVRILSRRLIGYEPLAPLAHACGAHSTGIRTIQG
jgi:hypothetical protein